MKLGIVGGPTPQESSSEAAAQLDFMRLLGSVYDEEVDAFSAEIPLAESPQRAEP